VTGSVNIQLERPNSDYKYWQDQYADVCSWRKGLKTGHSNCFGNFPDPINYLRFISSSKILVFNKSEISVLSVDPENPRKDVLVSKPLSTNNVDFLDRHRFVLRISEIEVQIKSCVFWL
jgi:hypothetical protein